MNGDTSGRPPVPDSDKSPWQYHAGSKAVSTPQPIVNTPNAVMPEFTWSASEYIAHAKSPQWYIALAVGTVLLAAGIYMWTRDIFSAVAIIIMVTLLGIFGARKPKVVEYKLTNTGLSVATKVYLYKDFRSFSIIDEGAFSSIQFMPLKRFMPAISVYYDPSDEELIFNILASHLPMDNRENGAVEHLARRIRY